MKTINFDMAQTIIYRLRVSKDSWLADFEKTGVINNPVNYHAEIDEMLSNPHRLLKKRLNELHQLKRYFNKYVPLPVDRARDEANIKTITFDNVTYDGEQTEFMITWSELGIKLIQPGQMPTIFSISLTDAKDLAEQILKY